MLRENFNFGIVKQMKRVQSLLPINCAGQALMTIDFSLLAERNVLTSVSSNV